MSTGSMPAYFHPQPEGHEVRVTRDLARDRLGHTTPAAAPSWTIQYSDTADGHQTIETEGIHIRSQYVGRGSLQLQHISTDFVAPPLQPPQRVRSASVQLHGVAAFPMHAVLAPQARHFSDGAMPRLGRTLPGCDPFYIDSGTGVREDPVSLGGVDVPHSSAPDPPVFHFPSPHQAWEETVTTTFTHRTDPPPPHVHVWEPNKPMHIHPLVHHEAPFVDPNHNAEDDHDGHTLLCEWTDERGTCNMDIVGERVWMSHHLSRYHNVVGHERTQRACLWRGCTDTMNKGSLARHVVSRHLRAGTSCVFCSKMYSRADVARRHSKKCKAANGTSVQTK